MESQLSERQEQIVDVAMRIIATEGARRFTVQALAFEIGVTGGAIYRHFESMEAIVDAVVQRVGHTLFRDFPPQAEDPIERLRLFFIGRARIIGENPHVSRLLLSDNLVQSCGAAYGEQLVEFKRRTSRFVMGCLEEAKAAGILHPELAPRVGAVLVVGGVLALSHVGAGLASAAPLAENVWAAIERTLRPLPASPEPTAPASARHTPPQAANHRKGTKP